MTKDTPNSDFVFVGNTGYGRINQLVETSNGTLRVGPVRDPNTGEYKPQWASFLVGMYKMCNKTSVPGSDRIVKDIDGRRITLERALQIELDGYSYVRD